MTDNKIVTKPIIDNLDQNSSRAEVADSTTATAVHTAHLTQNLGKYFLKINLKLISEDLLKQFEKCKTEALTPILGQLKRLKPISIFGKSVTGSSFNSRFTFFHLLLTYSLLRIRIYIIRNWAGIKKNYLWYLFDKKVIQVSPHVKLEEIKWSYQIQNIQNGKYKWKTQVCHIRCIYDQIWYEGYMS